jgi:leader peptidase (prepilin peptidase)/N-methyltransferase
VYPTGATLAVFLIFSCVVAGKYRPLFDSVIVGAAYCAFLFIVWFATGGRAMGFGDVRLAFFLGMAMGFYGFIVGYAGMLFAFFIGSLIGIAIAAITQGGRKMKIPFGPFLAAGTVLAIWLAPVIHDFVQRTNV